MLIRLSLLVVAACTVTGCAPDNGLTMGRVTGTVTYNGKPVEFGDILFLPDAEKGNQGVPSMGKIDKTGHYVMSTQESGDGVIAGAHKVGVRALDPNPVKEVATTETTPEPAPPASSPPGTESAGGSMSDRVAKRRAIALENKAAAKAKTKDKTNANTVTFNGTIYRFLASDRLANPETSGIRVVVPRGASRVDLAIQEDGTVKVVQ